MSCEGYQQIWMGNVTFRLFFLPSPSIHQLASHNSAKLAVRVWLRNRRLAVQLQYSGVNTIPTQKWNHCLLVKCLAMGFRDNNLNKNKKWLYTPEILDCTSSLAYLVKLHWTLVVSVSHQYCRKGLYFQQNTSPTFPTIFIGKFWSERSACAALGCWHKRMWPLF